MKDEDCTTRKEAAGMRNKLREEVQERLFALSNDFTKFKEFSYSEFKELKSFIHTIEKLVERNTLTHDKLNATIETHMANEDKDRADLKDTLKSMNSYLESLENKKMDKETFVAWKVGAIAAITLLFGGLAWVMFEFYGYKANDAAYKAKIDGKMELLPFQTAEMVKQYLNDSYNFQ